MFFKFFKKDCLTIVLLVVSIGASIFYVFLCRKMSQELELVRRQFEVQTDELSSVLQKNYLLKESLVLEKGRNDSFESELNNMVGTVGTLSKLSKTDPELLNKYSKIYFLSENYIPESLSPIKEEYLFKPESKLEIHTKVESYLNKLVETANQDGIKLKVASAYRSFDTQESLKSSYRVKYGSSAANQFSADQGYSEHQLGTTVDFATASSSFNGFEKTEAYEWLVNNAHRFGFVISFPPENDYFVFEPWHWRFVGVRLAEKVKEEDRYFYSWPQRTIDEYLVYLFD